MKQRPSESLIKSQIKLMTLVKIVGRALRNFLLQ